MSSSAFVNLVLNALTVAMVVFELVRLCQHLFVSVLEHAALFGQLLSQMRSRLLDDVILAVRVSHEALQLVIDLLLISTRFELLPVRALLKHSLVLIAVLFIQQRSLCATSACPEYAC